MRYTYSTLDIHISRCYKSAQISDTQCKSPNETKIITILHVRGYPKSSIINFLSHQLSQKIQ